MCFWWAVAKEYKESVGVDDEENKVYEDGSTVTEYYEDNGDDINDDNDGDDDEPE